MGDNYLTRLPRTAPWKRVIRLLEELASVENIASATMQASHKWLMDPAQFPAIVDSFHLLAKIIFSATKNDFVEQIKGLGLSVSDRPSLMELAGAFSEVLEKRNRTENFRSDLGEMAHLSASECLTSLVRDKTNKIFGNNLDEIKEALANHSHSNQFPKMAQDFLARFTKRYMMTFLSRELSNQVGIGHRFKNIDEHTEFINDLGKYCSQVSQSLQIFSNEWLQNNNIRQGISLSQTHQFIHGALEQIRRRNGL